MAEGLYNAQCRVGVVIICMFMLSKLISLKVAMLHTVSSIRIYVGCDSQNSKIKKSRAYNMSCIIWWNLIEKVTRAPKICGSVREVAMLKKDVAKFTAVNYVFAIWVDNVGN